MVWQQDVAIDKFGVIFRDSDKDTGNIDDDNSNIDLEGIEEDAEENDKVPIALKILKKRGGWRSSVTLM